MFFVILYLEMKRKHRLIFLAGKLENTRTKQKNAVIDKDYGGFEVFIAVVMKSIIFWDMTPCSPLSFNRRFGGTYRLHLQGRRNRFSKPASKQVASLKIPNIRDK
jgi:hypothetical protein